MKISATSRKWVLIFILLLVVLAGILGWMLYVILRPFELSSPEPQYQGKKLTEWARKMDRGDFYRLPAYQQHPKQTAEAIAAIRHIGTNALPAALELCRAQDPWLRTEVLRQIEQWVDEYNSSVEEYNQDLSKDQWRSGINVSFVWAFEKRYEGQNIVWALGSMTKPIVPDLVQLLKSKDRNIVADTRFFTLLGAGTNAIPPLLELINDTNQEVRLRAAIALASFFSLKRPANETNDLLLVPGSEDFRSQARAAVPVLLAGLERRKLNLVDRLQTIQALGLIREDAPTVVPILIHHIQSEMIKTNPMPDWMMLSVYFRALGDFGTNAKPVVPFLINILESNPNQPHSRDKEQALGNLLRIDPKIAQPFLKKWKASLTNNIY